MAGAATGRVGLSLISQWMRGVWLTIASTGGCWTVLSDRLVCCWRNGRWKTSALRANNFWMRLAVAFAIKIVPLLLVPNCFDPIAFVKLVLLPFGYSLACRIQGMPHHFPTFDAFGNFEFSE